MSKDNTAITALQHIAAGHDVLCASCGWTGEWHHLVGSEQRPHPHLCPDCGDEFLSRGANEIAAYAPATPMLDQLEAAPQPRTVQAAPSDRERQYMEALAVYANDEDRYNQGLGEPYGSIALEVGAIARQARAALAAAPDKPQHASPELVPVYPGPDLQRGDIVYTPSGRRAEVYNICEDAGTFTSQGQFCASVLRREKPNAALAPEPWGGPEGEE